MGILPYWENPQTLGHRLRFSQQPGFSHPHSHPLHRPAVKSGLERTALPGLALWGGGVEGGLALQVAKAWINRNFPELKTSWVWHSQGHGQAQKVGCSGHGLASMMWPARVGNGPASMMCLNQVWEMGYSHLNIPNYHNHWFPVSIAVLSWITIAS